MGLYGSVSSLTAESNSRRARKSQTMKGRILHLFALSTLILMLPSLAEAQMARKIPMFEHFTNASCPPCAAQNPIFEAVKDQNTGNLAHVAYHTSWPGTDPMYSANSAENNAWVGIYGISGVPAMVLDGTNIGGPAGVTQQTIDAAAGQGSPVRVLVAESTSGSTRDVTITVESVNTPPSGTYRLKAMIVEADVDYGTPPGTNGESFFPNVFRETLNGTGGQVITLPAMGSSDDYDFSYTLDGSWVDAHVYVIAYVVDNSGDVVNAGATNLPDYDLSIGAAASFQAASSSNSFNALLENRGTSSNNISITMTSVHPSDWSADFSIGGSNYSSSHTMDVSAGAAEDITINVTPGSSSAIAEYILTIESNDDTEYAPQTLRFYVINDVTDLVVNNVEGFGDGSPYGTWDWESIYTDGLSDAGRSTVAATSHFTFIAGRDQNALAGVRNIYYNVGWTFPSGSDNKVQALMDFMDEGGNLFIAGQDIGWEIMDAGSPYGTPTNRIFYMDYLHTSYNSDGAPTNNSLEFDAADSWMGTAGSSSISTPYGSGFMYPEEVSANSSDASTILYYNGNASKTGGVRSDNGTYKTVYIGVGLEMIDDVDVRSDIVQLAHDYFWDGLSGVEFDDALQAVVLGSAYPNPASGYTMLPLENLKESATLQVVSIDGKILRSQLAAPGQSVLRVDLEGLAPGLYQYYLESEGSRSQVGKIQVIR